MLFRFGPFELNAATFELRCADEPVAVEPQVLSLLLLLVEHRDRLVTRDEIIETIWKGRIVSDAALSSRIKSARQALGDDGTRQAMIRTIHGQGFRFVHPVDTPAPAPVPAAPKPDMPPEAIARPSIAVLPFLLHGDRDRPARLIADALPHELIVELSRLRWLFVIARGSSFRFRSPHLDIRRVGAILGVRYCVSGSIEAAGGRMALTVELADTHDRGVIWSERYQLAVGDVHDVRAQVTSSIIAALELHIPANEARKARLQAPGDLDAWSAYHLGLQHMYRFNRADNAAAIGMFEAALVRDPDFARAHGGLSFARFQNAFVGYSADIAGEADAARRHAARAVEIDGLDSFANLTMGRSLWLTGDIGTSLGWLDRSILLNPNSAQGVYSRAWAETVMGKGDEGQRDADLAMALSPVDPLHYAMLATRALSHLVRGDAAEAAAWSDRAARAPGAHVLIAVIAAACCAVAGDAARATAWARDVRRRSPGFRQPDFFRSFPFDDPATRARIASGLAMAGL